MQMQKSPQARHRTMPLPAIAALLLGLCTGCSAKYGGRSGSATPVDQFAASYEREAAQAPGLAYDDSALSAPVFKDMSNLYGEAGEAPAPGPAAADVPVQERKLVKSAEIRIRSDNLEEAGRAVAELVESCKGYAGSTIRRDNSLRYTLKIPQAFYETALTGVSKLGKILYQSENTEDVTINFYDLDSRLRTKQELLKTFQSYLGKAKDIEEIMSVEKRIAELQQEIDWIGSQLSTLSHLVDYATIEIDIQGPLSDSPYYKPGIGERIGDLIGSFGGYASGTLLILIGIAVYGVPTLLVFTLLFWLLFGKIGLIKKLWRLVMGKGRN